MCAANANPDIGLNVRFRTLCDTSIDGIVRNAEHTTRLQRFFKPQV
jgi:hypothetical protein